MFLFALALTLAGAGLAQSPKSGPNLPHTDALHTKDGHSDLQGNWTNSTMTLLQRPMGLNRTLTEEEAAKFEDAVRKDRSSDRRDGPPEVDIGRAYNELFFTWGTKLARIGGVIRTSLIVDPPDGHLPPYTLEARRRINDQSMEALDHPANRPQDRSLAERCLLWAGEPPMLPSPYNGNYQIVQTPDYVMILIEMMHDVRIIPLDGSPHLPSNVRLWMGDSRGHWEGETLVVDTTNFTDKTAYLGTTQDLHVIERFTRVDAKTILYSFTIDDPSTFLRPWTAEVPFVAIPGPVYEYACHEGNYALVDILKGARAEEKAAQDNVQK